VIKEIIVKQGLSEDMHLKNDESTQCKMYNQYPTFSSVTYDDYFDVVCRTGYGI